MTTGRGQDLGARVSVDQHRSRKRGARNAGIVARSDAPPLVASLIACLLRQLDTVRLTVTTQTIFR